MTNLGLNGRRGARAWLMSSLFFALAGAAGCATQETSGGVGGAGGGGSTSSTMSSTTGGGEGGMGGMMATGGMGGMMATGGMGGMMATGGMGGAGGMGMGGMGGAGGMGMGGMGGMGGSPPMPPMGSADYPLEVEQNDLKSTANPLAMGTKGFTGWVYPLGDIDTFSFDVTTPGTSVTVSTGDGMGACPPGVATYVRVYDNNGVLLASDTNCGPDNCSLLSPTTKTSLQGLTAGKYYVKVENAGSTPILFYVVDIALNAPSCGDGIRQLASGEQCDDGNVANGDGCSGTCQLEGNYISEVEANDTAATGNSLNGKDGVVASINPVADNDYFCFDVTVPGSSVTLEVNDGFGVCPTGFDSKIYLYDSSNTEIASDDDDGDAACSKIQPSADAGANNLAVGSYCVKVEEFGNNATTPFYVLKIKLSPPGCGDGIVQSGEQCDDGNSVNGDGCSTACKFEANYLSEVEPNNAFIDANPVGSADGFSAAINPVADVDFFSFDVTVPGSSVLIETTDGANGCPTGFDSQIYLYNANKTQLVSDDQDGVDSCSKISSALDAGASNLPVGTYYVKVEEFGNNAAQPFYVLKIKVTPPGCGDGIAQSGEQCDDGNSVDDDGCSNTCQAQAPYELEPNNSQMTATPLWPGTTRWVGSIKPVGDHDWFEITLSAPGSIRLETHTRNDPAACPGDTKIYLVDSNGTQIASDDDDGQGSCSLIDPATDPTSALQAGNYYVWVQRYNDSSEISLYQLDVTVQ